MIRSKLPTWMTTEKIMAFRVFSTEDEDKDFTKLDKFHIDTAVFFNGKTFFIFSDVINEKQRGGRYTYIVRDRKAMKDWLDTLDKDITLLGFNSTKLDYQLLLKAFEMEFRTIDLMDAIGLVVAEEYDIEKKRYTLREATRCNSIKQTVLPHFSWVFNSVELFTEWFNQRFRGAIKSLCAECELIAKLGYRIRRKGEVRILDPVTGGGVMLSLDFHDHALPKGFFVTVSPEIEASE